MTLGVLTLAAYIKIGIEHRDRVGERYVPISAQEQSSTQATGMISADIAPAAVIKTRG